MCRWANLQMPVWKCKLKNIITPFFLIKFVHLQMCRWANLHIVLLPFNSKTIRIELFYSYMNEFYIQLTIMKKSIISSVILFFIAAAGYSQHLSVNAFGGYTFRDKIDYGNAYTYINGGGMW